MPFPGRADRLTGGADRRPGGQRLARGDHDPAAVPRGDLDDPDPSGTGGRPSRGIIATPRTAATRVSWVSN
jgi:hypothetical protein